MAKSSCEWYGQQPPVKQFDWDRIRCVTGRCSLLITDLLSWVGDYYFVKAANDLVSLGVLDCNGNLTGSSPSTPSSSSSPSASSTVRSESSATQLTPVQIGFFMMLSLLLSFML